MKEPSKNLQSVFLGIGEFSFSRGALTRAAALAAGFKDRGDIMAFSIETENTQEESEGSYRTGKRVDKVFSTKQKIEYVLKSREMNGDNLRSLLMADEPDGNNIADALTLAAGDALPFNLNPSQADRWYDLTYDGARRMPITAAFLARAAINGVAEADDDTITANAHGLANGQRVVITSAAPGGLEAGVVYFVRDTATNTFKLAATAAGAALGISADGNPVIRPILTPDVDYELDLRLGRARFLVDQNVAITPLITAAAVTADDPTYLVSAAPMENPTEEGYGRLVIFDPENPDQVKYDHRDFSCTVTSEKSGEINGKKPPEFTLRVTITTDAGDVFFAGALAAK